MYLPIVLIALLAVTGLADSPDRAHEVPVAEMSTTTPAAVSPTVPDGVTVEQLDIVVPAVDAAGAVAAADAVPEVRANSGRVVADHLVASKRVASEVVPAAEFQTLGVTWPEGTDVSTLGGTYRTRTNGTWSDWTDLEAGDSSPDTGTSDAAHALRGGTDALSIADADAVQLGFAADADGGPPGLKLALVGSTMPAVTAEAGSTSAPIPGKASIQTASYFTSTAAATPSAAPAVITRAQWGAPAQACAPDVAKTLVGAVVHHTADSNSYSTVAEAKQRIRNDAIYHINTRGWCDIGYNFVVDKWGNIYEGRANSLTQPVIGVHTGGFNTGTLGVALLGTYDAAPSAATQHAVAQIIGWRLGSYGLDPQGSMSYKTGAGENSRFINQTVTLPRIFGHRDTAYTACPGNGGHAALPAIRAMAADVARSSAQLNSPPIGHVDSIASTGASLVVRGWVLDPDTTDSIHMHVYVDGVGTSLLADGPRPDVGAAFGNGSLHGFEVTVPATPGDHRVCVYGIDSAGGSNPTLWCGTVRGGGPPIGSYDFATTAPGAVVVGGWALDPDTDGPISVHVYIDGALTGVRADRERPDVASIFGAGSRHGFLATLPTLTGTHKVCIYAIDYPSGTNPFLGCRSVLVTNPVPFGFIDVAIAGEGTVTIKGWALDPDTTDPISVHVYIDRALTAVRADTSRPDVEAAFGNGDRHGFDAQVAATPGVHRVCLYAINTPVGSNPTLGCSSLTVS